MAVGYPPQPVYPYGIDSDYTLFLVYNTAESTLVEDNNPWSEEIVITARANTQPEVWAANGFANINGELIYYDAVELDDNGKVYKLKRCARNLGGAPTQFNPAGTMVRGFVVAEHHNQLVTGITLTEQFIGYNFTPDQTSLDWRIRNLQAVPIIFDDFGCPDVVFHFTVTSSDPSAGTTVNYSLDVTGSFNEFLLSFGDGSTTSSVQQGTHIYAPNAAIDPIATFTNQNCQIVQTPMQRDSVNAPQPQTVQTSFDIPNLPNFVFPTINVQSPSFPQPDMTLPPYQFPCIDLSPLGISPVHIPSMIMFEPAVNLPSMIDFQPINIPSFIGIGNINLPSIIDIIGPDIPSVIVLTAPTLPNISLEVPTFPTLSLTVPNISVVVPTLPTISVVVPTFPSISINTATFPTLSVNVPTFPSISVNVPTFPGISVTVPPNTCIPLCTGTMPNISVTWGTPPAISATWANPPAISATWASPPSISVTWSSPPALNVTWGTPPALPITWGTAPNVPITWGSPPTVPVGWTPVPTVNIGWGTPPNVPITWGIAPNVPIAWGSPPQVTVNWGTPPTIQVNVTVTCPSTPLALAAADPLGVTDDMLGIGKDLQVEYDVSGFPSEIKVIPPEIPDVRVIHDIPDEITVKTPSFPDLRIQEPDWDIRILPPETQLTIEAVGIPDVINLVPTVPIPERIELYVPVKIPDRIILEHDLPDVIRVEGLPDVVRLEHNLPSVIRLEMPEKPEIELVYKGSGIPVQIQLDFQKLIGDAEDVQCVAIVPCPRK